MACALVACDDDDDKVMTQTPVTLRSQSIAEGASVLAGTTTQLTLSYNYHMAINDAVNVTVNGTNVTPVIDAADVKNVIIPLALNAGVDYTISVSLNGTNIYSATESPKARTLTIPDENWEALSLEQVHTVVMLITQGDKQIERTFRFKKFLYSYDTLYGLFTGIAKATRIKRAYNKQLVAAEFPNEILKISGIKEETSPSYIDVVLSYVEGGVIIVTQVDGDIYGADIDPSGTTRITVDFTGVYTVQGYIGDSPSSSATVTIIEAGETKTVTLQWTQLMVMTLPGSSVTAVNNTNVVTGTSGESGAAELYLPSAGVWELSATNEDYSFAAANSSTIDGYGTYTSELDFVSPVFEENSWETIARVVKEGKAESYWNVGDCKAVIFNGILGE